MSTIWQPQNCSWCRVHLATIALCLLGLLALPTHPTWGQQTNDNPPTAKDAKDIEAARFKAFEKKLSGSVWNGKFSMDGDASQLREETYEIASVKKLPSGDLWLFNARIKYGGHDVTVPIPLKVMWSGKTPMIVVDHVTIPGLGTFDSHVLISGHRYAGTWQHGDVGGHLFGTIKSADP